MDALRKVLAGVGIAGALGFGAIFVASLVDPPFVERIGRDLIRQQVEKEVREKIASLDSAFLVERARRYLKLNAEQAELNRRLLEGLSARVAKVTTQMRDPQCRCRAEAQRLIASAFEGSLTSLSQVSHQLEDLIRAKYLQVASQLMRELRIFTGANALVFGFLAVAAMVKRQAGLHLVPPALVLLASAAVVGSLYLFGQDWLHTIVFNDYVGFAYFGYLSVAFAFLFDIAFNRGRVTTTLLSGFFTAIGSVTVVVNC